MLQKRWAVNSGTLTGAREIHFRCLEVLVASMVGTVQVGEHLLLPNDWPVSLLGHQVLALVVLFGNLFVVFLALESFTVLLDDGSES